MGIIGSELSRELFDKDKSEIQNDFEVVFYRKDTSVISVMSKAQEYDLNQLQKVMPVEKSQQILDELEKGILNGLIAEQPDVLVVDFYSDILDGVIETQSGSFLANSVENMKIYALSGIVLKKLWRSNESVQDFIDYSHIWCEALKNFIEFVQKFLPKTVLLVNTIDLSKENMLENNMGQVWFRFNEYAEKMGIPVINDKLSELYQHTFKDQETGQPEPSSQSENTDRQPLTILSVNSNEPEAAVNFIDPPLGRNLIRNSNFADGKKHWQDDSEEYFVKNGIVEINRTTMEGFTILHSDPIQISANGNLIRKFELSMEVWVENLFALHLNDAFFYVWTYDDKVSKEIKERKIYSSKMENLSSGKWKHINIELKCKGKYLELGPHMVGAGHFRYRNLSLSLKD